MTKEQRTNITRIYTEDIGEEEEPTYRLRDILSDDATCQHYATRLQHTSRHTWRLVRAALPLVLVGVVVAVALVIILMLATWYLGAIGL